MRRSRERVAERQTCVAERAKDTPRVATQQVDAVRTIAAHEGQKLRLAQQLFLVTSRELAQNVESR